MGNVLLSKIVANSNDIAWSQAYSTLNLYIALSLEITQEDDLENPHESSKDQTNIALHGKNILEKMQREFFATDEKNLPSIKKTLENVVKGIEKNLNYSIILATIVNNTLYIVTAGKGYVILKREGKIGIVASGEDKKITAFSGIIQNNDIVVIQTQGFCEKIKLTKLSGLLDGLIVTEISENIAPFIHEGSKGTEAAIILEYKETHTEMEDAENHEDSNYLEKTALSPQTSDNKIKIPNFNIPFLSKLNFISWKKSFVLFTILILIAVFVIAIVLENQKKESQKNAALLQSILAPSQKKYDEGLALISLNKALAIDNLNLAKEKLVAEKDKFKEGSKEKLQIESFIKDIDAKLNELEESTTTIKSQNQIFEANSTVKQIGSITLKGEELAVNDKSNGNVLLLDKSDGKTTKSIQTEAKNLQLITGDKENLYLASVDGIYKVEKKSKKSQKIISFSNGSATNGMDVFAGNVYIVNNSDIEKYTPSDYKKLSYLVGDTKLNTKTVSMTIDASIWILEENGKIKKFTRGKDDGFSLSGFSKSISKNSILYTDSEFSNLYVLDKDNKKVFIINKNGDYQGSVDLKNISGANSIAVDEANKKIYVSTTNKIYSIEF